MTNWRKFQIWIFFLCASVGYWKRCGGPPILHPSFKSLQWRTNSCRYSARWKRPKQDKTVTGKLELLNRYKVQPTVGQREAAEILGI